MKENKYDDPSFFEKYAQMDRSRLGLSGAGEWATLKQMLPDFHGKRVLDLGCGYGWHCVYAAAGGAKSVLGVDLSERMLAVAREKTAYSNVRYERAAMEDLEFPEGSFDAVISSLALHYVEDYRALVGRIYNWLSNGGWFVFSAEHPVFTAYGSQDWIYGGNGEILHFPVDNYYREGARRAVFLGEEMTKYHRTLTTYLDTLVAAGFTLRRVAEPTPPAEMKDEFRRPMMLLVSAQK